MPYLPQNNLTITPVTQSSATVESHEELESQREAARPGFLGGLLGSTALAIPDFVDTVASSIPFSPIERGDLNQKFLSAIGSPTLNRFATEQQGATELVSGIGGIFIADRIAGRLFRSGGLVMSGMRQMPGIRAIAALDKQYDVALRAAQVGMREAASRGEMGTAAFQGVMNFKSLGVQTSIDLGKARAGVTRTSALQGAGRAAGTELVMTGIMNTNSIFYTDDTLDNMANAALGIGVGGFLGGIQGGWALRKAANSKAMEAEAIHAYDPKGFELARRTVSGIDEILGKNFLGYDHELETSLITSQMIHAKESRLPTQNNEAGRRLFSNRESFANQLETQALTNLNKVTTSGLNAVNGTSFNDAGNAFKSLREGIHREPTLLYGAAEVGQPNGWNKGKDGLGITLTDVARKTALESRMDAISKIFKQGGLEKVGPDGKTFIEDLSEQQRLDLQNEMRKLWYDNSKQGFVMLTPGELAPMEFGRVVDNIQDRRIVREVSGGKTTWSAERLSETDSLIGIGDDLTIYTQKNRPLSHLPMHDVLQFYRVARHVTDRLAKGPKTIVLPKKPNWAQLDMAERIIQKSNNPAKIVFPDGMSRQNAIVESMAQKVDAIRGSLSSGPASKQPIFGAKAFKRNRPPANDVDAFAARIKFNMPQFTPHEASIFRTHENPLEVLLYSFKDGDEVRALGYDGLKQAVKEASSIQGLTDDIARKFEDMNGKSFDFMMNEDGTPATPILIYKRPMLPDDWTRRALDSSIAHRKAFQRSGLIGESADPIIRALATQLLASPELAQALKVAELSDNQHFSWIPGMVNKPPQSFFGSLTDSLNVGGREFRDRDNLTMLSASRVKDLQDRLTRELMAKTVSETMGDIMTRVSAPRNGQSRVMLNHFFAQRQGWDLAEEAVETRLANGQQGFQFKLADTGKNRERFELQFGRPMEEGELLQNAQGVTIVLDALGMEALTRFSTLADTRRSMQNTLLRSQGLPEIQRQPWWVPSPQTRGKFVAFTFDESGRVVPGGGIVANTAEQLAEEERKITASSWFRPGYVIRRRDRVTAFMDLWDKAQMDWHDASSAAVQTGKVNRGRLATQEIDLKAWDRANAMMVDGFIEQGSDLLNLLTKDSVIAARARAEASRTETALGRSDRQLKHQGIFDRYIQNITGQAASQNRQGMISPIFNAVEDRINDFLQTVTPNSSKLYQALSDKFKYINPFRKSDTHKELFDKLVKNLGPHMPFNSVAEMVEAQTGHALPKEIKEISAKISWLEATSKLRWFESVHALMNFGSMVHNMPAITKGIQRLSGETDEMWAKRIGHVASIFGEKRQTAVVNPAKILYLAFQDARKDRFGEFTTKAFNRGFMNQEVAELERQYSTIKTPGAMRAFLFGDAKADPSTLRGRIAKKGGLDYYLGYMSDKSEDYTRRIAMYYGRRVAQLNGIESVDDQLSFAHNFANQTIANYDPRNRPEIFQGWLGAPIGLFQSYVTNYYARMFRLFETKNTQALASQFLWQSGIFGVKSFGPFWDQANRMFFDRGGVLNEDQSDSFEHRLGTTEGDILMYGVLSNLPKLFGGDGASVYTRGDINVRLPVLNMPIADSVKRIWNGTSQMLDAFANNTEGVTNQQLAEILSNTLGNRPLAGMIETFGAGGFDTDKNGQVVAANETFASLNTAYRLMGIRSMQQQKAIDAFYADKEAGEEQAARQTTLRMETRANVRAGNFDALPNLFVKYVENGGDVKYFTRWYKDAMESALETRSERRLQDLMKNGKKMASVNRLLDAGVSPLDEDNADDYGAEEERKTAIKAKVDEMLSVQESMNDPLN